MTHKQIKYLQYLDNKIVQCYACDLYKGGRAKPYWAKQSNYAIVGEAPGENEVSFCEPFIGDAGKLLWEVAELFGFKKHDFLIINACNCRPVKANKNGKPRLSQMITCNAWLRMYFTVFKPKHTLLLGAYAQNSTANLPMTGVTHPDRVGNVLYNKTLNTMQILSVHPSYCNYKNDTTQLEIAFKSFKKEVMK